MNKKEGFVRKILKPNHNNNIESNLIQDSQFVASVESVLSKGKNTIPLSETTVEILDNVLEPMEISKALSHQLSQTMLKAEEHRQYLRKIKHFISSGLFADYFTLLRKEQDMSVRNIALKTGIREDLLRGIENGKTEFVINIGAEKLLELADFLRSPITDFIQIVKMSVRSLARSRSFSLAFASSQENKSQSVHKSIKRFLSDFEKKAELFAREHKNTNASIEGQETE